MRPHRVLHPWAGSMLFGGTYGTRSIQKDREYLMGQPGIVGDATGTTPGPTERSGEIFFLDMPSLGAAEPQPKHFDELAAGFAIKSLSTSNSMEVCQIRPLAECVHFIAQRQGGRYENTSCPLQ